MSGYGPSTDHPRDEKSGRFIRRENPDERAAKAEEKEVEKQLVGKDSASDVEANSTKTDGSGVEPEKLEPEVASDDGDAGLDADSQAETRSETQSETQSVAQSEAQLGTHSETLQEIQ